MLSLLKLNSLHSRFAAHVTSFLLDTFAHFNLYSFSTLPLLKVLPAEQVRRVVEEDLNDLIWRQGRRSRTTTTREEQPAANI